MRLTRLLLIPIFLFGLFQLRGGDLLWHLAVGKKILAEKSLAPDDTFSHTFAGQKVAPHGPVFQVVVAGIEKKFGMPGLVVLRALLLAAVFGVMLGLMHHFAPNGGLPEGLFLAALFLSIFAQADLHPQLMTYLFTPLTLRLALVRWPTRWPYRVFMLTTVMVLWALIHPSFPLGVVLLLLCGSLFADTSLIASAALSLLCLALLSPSTLTNVWVHQQSAEMLQYIKYWQPLFASLSDSWFSRAIAAVVVALTLFGGLLALRDLAKNQRRALLYFAMAALFSFMAMRHLRFYPLVIVALAPYVIAFWPAWARGRCWRYLPWLIFAASIALLTASNFYRWGLRLDESQLPVGEVDYILRTHPDGKLFNSYNFGGYILYRTNGALRVYIDPRSSQLYPDAFFKEFIDAHHDPKLFDSIVQRRGIGMTLLKLDSTLTKPLIAYLDGSPGWKRAFVGPVGVVHTLR